MIAFWLIESLLTLAYIAFSYAIAIFVARRDPEFEELDNLHANVVVFAPVTLPLLLITLWDISRK